MILRTLLSIELIDPHFVSLPEPSFHFITVSNFKIRFYQSKKLLFYRISQWISIDSSNLSIKSINPIITLQLLRKD
jgi:hypothetical protein